MSHANKGIIKCIFCKGFIENRSMCGAKCGASLTVRNELIKNEWSFVYWRAHSWNVAQSGRNSSVRIEMWPDYKVVSSRLSLTIQTLHRPAMMRNPLFHQPCSQTASQSGFYPCCSRSLSWSNLLRASVATIAALQTVLSDYVCYSFLTLQMWRQKHHHSRNFDRKSLSSEKPSKLSQTLTIWAF